MEKRPARVGGWRILKRPGGGQTSRTPLWLPLVDFYRVWPYISNNREMT
jgi:hypothetical protein